MVHLCVLALCLALLPAQTDLFRAAQVIATIAAMTSNFVLNNELTYRDRRLKGWALPRGFVLFCLIGSVGVLANIDLASWLYIERPVWWVARRLGRDHERAVELRHVHPLCLARPVTPAATKVAAWAQWGLVFLFLARGLAAALVPLSADRGLLLAVVEASGCRLFRSSPRHRLPDPGGERRCLAIRRRAFAPRAWRCRCRQAGLSGKARAQS